MSKSKALFTPEPGDDISRYSLKVPESNIERVIRNQAGDVIIQSFSNKGTYQVPIMGSKCTKYTQDNLNLALLARGEREVMNYQCSLNGHLNEDVYELIRTNNLSPDTLAALNPKMTRLAAEPKFIFLKRRYYLDLNGLIHDHLRNDRIVCEPVFVFDMIMGCHLMNDHGTYGNVFQSLADFYSNITRDLTNKTLQYCSKCNPEEKIERLEKFKHRNLYKKMMPLERIHIELIEPFKGQKIENKYSHILYARDYHSRYVWALPVKDLKFKKIVKSVAEFLFTLMRQPIFIETTSIPESDMFDICETIAKKYGITLGLGTKKLKIFHSHGVIHMKRRLNLHKEECLKDWNMCLKYGVIDYNRTFNDRAGATPSDMLCSEVHEIGQKFKDKIDQILDDSNEKSVVKTGNGLLYIEVSEEKVADIESEVEEESESEGEDEEEEEDMSNTVNNDDAETLTGMIPVDTTSSSDATVVTTRPTISSGKRKTSTVQGRSTKRSKKDEMKSEGVSMEI